MGKDGRDVKRAVSGIGQIGMSIRFAAVNCVSGIAPFTILSVLVDLGACDTEVNQQTGDRDEHGRIEPSVPSLIPICAHLQAGSPLKSKTVQTHKHSAKETEKQNLTDGPGRASAPDKRGDSNESEAEEEKNAHPQNPPAGWELKAIRITKANTSPTSINAIKTVSEVLPQWPRGKPA